MAAARLTPKALGTATQHTNAAQLSIREEEVKSHQRHCVLILYVSFLMFSAW